MNEYSWWRGKAKCNACEHTWDASIETLGGKAPTVMLECPSCHQYAGQPADTNNPMFNREERRHSPEAALLRPGRTKGKRK
jgi:hypothetical protein